METKENTGAIFKNDKKTSDKAPDYKGKINVDGVDKDIALWVRESKNGVKYLSVKIEEPFQKTAPVQESAPKYDNDLPF
jgi:uncharacterized protein (DUF736 family)